MHAEQRPANAVNCIGKHLQRVLAAQMQKAATSWVRPVRQRQTGRFGQKGGASTPGPLWFVPEIYDLFRIIFGAGGHFVLSLYYCKVGQSVHALTGVLLVPGVNWLPRVL